jgi:hypothetical protein
VETLLDAVIERLGGAVEERPEEAAAGKPWSPL